MKKRTLFWTLISITAICNSVWAAPERVIIKFKPGMNIATVSSSLGIALQPMYGTQQFATAIVDSSTEQLTRLQSLSSVEYIEKDILYSVDSPQQANTTDPRQNELWGIEKIGVPNAWKSGVTGSREIVVAVIDTGINWGHPDLAPNLWQNPGEKGALGVNGRDDDGNGLVDDVHGWNFVEKTPNTDDDWGHGSHCAGTIGAVGNNSIGVSGVNWQVSLMPVQWMKEGKGWGSDAISSIRYAVKMGARVLNNSWGGIGYSKALEDAVREAEAAGVLFVVSAGNHGTNNDTTPRHPATLKLPNILAVADTDHNDQLASTSNFGAQSVHLAAPGEKILSTGLGKSYRLLSGTSMAAAHASGLAALYLSQHPEWKYPQLKEALMKTGDRIPALVGKTISGVRIQWKN